ncbi:arginase family protein [Roseovarius sp. CAU 1744]|uniref:arginase family protein n=1 Tax=Roseovarius sp. CAU 1744 TaxID=3140368 RepID=UPI00325AFDB7
MTLLDEILAPSALGLAPNGVQDGPSVLKQLGLFAGLPLRRQCQVESPPYRDLRSETLHILNADALVGYSASLAHEVRASLDAGAFPVVIGGDCSVLLGCGLAVADEDAGLFFLDGHQDFYLPEQSPTGEAADMDLAIVTGHASPEVQCLFGDRPLYAPEHTILFGNRDDHDVIEDNAMRLPATALLHLPLSSLGVDPLRQARSAIAARLGTERRFWVHLDVDVIEDADMYAVDYRLPGGLPLSQLARVLDYLMSTGRVLGMDVTIYNPRLDGADYPCGRRLVELLNTCFARFGAEKSHRA